ncbi:TAP-like protein-domain-containing protein [Flammula alnicola]|nr:TAP-like protein-domain-containing protein [Flammula alnicola]
MARMTKAVLSIAFVLVGIALLGQQNRIFSEIVPTALKSVVDVDEFSWGKIVAQKELKWHKCYEGRQCARLLVPLNYSEPDGQQAGIALIRKPAVVPRKSEFYRGPVLFNPGGPGGSGVDLVRLAGDLLSKILGPQFDIVSFDPRGIGRSQPHASFFKTDVEREIWNLDLKVVNNSAEGVARGWARARVLGQLAAETDDGYLRHINTDQTARDMLKIVEAHGRSKIQYWGFSYGSVLGATFAAMFPDKIERFVIDGVVDSENYYATSWSNNLLDTDKVMDSFYTGCAEAGPDSCAFWAPTVDDIRQNLTTLYDSLRSHPMPMRTKSGYGLLDLPMLRSAIFLALYTPYASFPIIAQGLAELATGEGQLLFDRMNRPPFECSCDSPERAFASVPDATAAVLCNDGDDIPGDLESTQKYFDMMTKTSNWGDIWSNIRISCVGWPKFPKDHFQGPFEANTSHPILLIGNTADPVTPLWAAKKMSRGFTGSVVLTQDSAGHCSISAPSVCTQKYVRDYFIDGTLPEPGTVCQPIGQPFPISDLNSEEAQNQAVLTSNLTPDEKEIYAAILELSKTPGIIPLPGHLSSRAAAKVEAGCKL